MIPPEPTDPTTPAQWLIQCSPARTLIARRAGTEIVLVKLFETGSLADAQRELAWGRLLADQPIARHRDAGIDATTGKVSLTLDHRAGLDLESWLQQRGALESREAAHVALGIARALEGFTRVAVASAPHGVVHCDVKPSNVLLAGDGRDAMSASVVLLDLEHVRPAAPPDASPAEGSGFTGGTHGFAPPEAYLGRAANAAFDVFGLGCTLFAMLAGHAPFQGRDDGERSRAVADLRWRRRALLGRPGALADLVGRCLERDPDRRPSAGDIATELDAFLQHDAGDGAVERALLRVLRGESETTATLDASARGRAVLALAARRARLLARVDPPADFDETAESGAALRAIAAAAPRLAAFLRRFPSHPRALAVQALMLNTLPRLLDAVLPSVSADKRGARFAAALELVADAEAALAAARRLGRIPVAARASAQPAPMQRDPERALELSRHDIESAQRRHERLVARLRAAEAAVDLAGAAAVLDEFSALYGGASEVVAALKDERLKREFYLARIAQQRPLMRDLRELADSTSLELDLGPLDAFLTLCTRSPEIEEYARPEPESVRALRRGLGDLLREFPHLAEHAGPALESLEHALNALTDRAAEFLRDASHKLATPPIPIRPLQSILSRLDTMRLLDVLVDRPGRTRGHLLDDIESLRTELQQARTTRDRITRGAQEAMDRGHLTTALYEMGRAVDQFGDAGDPDDTTNDGPRLAEQYEEAQRRKQAIAARVGDNARIAAALAASRDDPNSSARDRAALLQERERVLEFLCTNLPSDRAQPFGEDLRIVQLDLFRERAALAQARLADAKTDDVRHAVARQTVELLERTTPSSSWGDAHARDVHRILDDWRSIRDATAPAQTGRDAQPSASRSRWRRVLDRLRGRTRRGE